MQSARLVLVATALILAIILVPHTSAPAAVRPAPTEPSPFLFGVLNNQGTHHADEWARGVRATTLELQWRRYEPQPGVYDTAYIQSMQQQLRALKDQGWYVQLVPGYQYVPDWVFTKYPSMRYVNQYGETYTPVRSSFTVINAPFNPQARALIAGYLARIFQDFSAADFDSVRVGGGVQGELRYPPQDWNGHTNSFWAFDSYAQSPAISGIPAQAVGWRPSIDANPGSLDRGQLLINAGFEQIHAYLPIPGWAPDDGAQVTRYAANPRSGTYALKLTSTPPHRVHQFVAVAPSTAYELAGWLRSGGSGAARIYATPYDSTMQPISKAPLAELESSASGWTQHSASLTTDAQTAYLKVELDGSAAGSFWFDDLQLTRQGERNLRSRDIDVPLAFYDWYLQQLIDYQNWQIAELRRHYGGQLDLIYAGKGLSLNQLNDALTNDLRGTGWSEGSSALYAATLYERILAALSSTENIAIYVTGIDEPAATEVNDRSPDPSEWSASRWLAVFARCHSMPIWGENSGQDDYATMQLTGQRMRNNGFFGMMWGFESELYTGEPNAAGYATIDQYEQLIAHYHRGPVRSYLPLTPLLAQDDGGDGGDGGTGGGHQHFMPLLAQNDGGMVQSCLAFR